MTNPRSPSTGRKRSRRLLGIAVAFVVVPAIAISAAGASPAAVAAGSPPEKQIAALKKQVRALKRQTNQLKAQVGSLREDAKVLNGRITSLQQELALVPQLAEIAAATGRYRDLANALADGYVRADTRGCIPTAGIHYMRGEWPNDNVLDPLKPEFLTYAAIGGNLKLVALEYAVPTRFSEPTFLGRPFQTYGGGPGEPIWYLHVWLWHLNPAGTFADENPTVQC